jgi:ABC-type transport system involved in multi-copper enzyme maturation permease subunit
MKRLLSIELQKIWKNRASKVLTLSYFVILSFIAFIASIKFDIGPVHINLADQGIFNFPYIWHFNSYIACLGKLFFAVVVVSMMANEYSYGTFKQNLIDGLDKKEFILSKFYTILLFSVISTVFVFIISIILGLIFSPYDEVSIIFSDLEYLLAYFLNLVGFFSFCLFVAVLVKRSAFALGFVFVWFIGEKISYGLLYYNFTNKSPIVESIYKFAPLESISNLLVEPFSRLKFVKTIGTQVGVENLKDFAVHPSSVIIVLIWTFIFIFLSYKIIQKRDL